VRKARDTTLKRDTALKVLPDKFLRSPDRVQFGIGIKRTPIGARSRDQRFA